MQVENKIIEEVDQKLEEELGNVKKISAINEIYGQLNYMKRQVNKFVQKMNYNQKMLPTIMANQLQAKQEDSANKKQRGIGKYNYYGKKYRFEEKEEELKIQPPSNVGRKCMSEINCSEASPKMSLKTQKTGCRRQKQSNKATMSHIDQRIFYDDGQIKIPSNHYYIYFDKSSSGKVQKKHQKLTDNQYKQFQNELRQQQKHQKFKPAWLMQKKINMLQKQVKDMKQRQKKRTLSQLDNKKMRNTYDGPIQLRSNIQKMVESLWI